MLQVIATVDYPDAHIPIAILAPVFTAMVGGVIYMFKTVMATNKERLAELARVTETLAADMRKQWAIVERVNLIRVMEIAAFPHVAPQLRDDAKKVADDIREVEADARRKDLK